MRNGEYFKTPGEFIWILWSLLWFLEVDGYFAWTCHHTFGGIHRVCVIKKEAPVVAEDVQSVINSDNVTQDVDKERHLQRQQSTSLSSIYSEGIKLSNRTKKSIARDENSLFDRYLVITKSSTARCTKYWYRWTDTEFIDGCLMLRLKLMGDLLSLYSAIIVLLIWSLFLFLKKGLRIGILMWWEQMYLTMNTD